MDGRVDAGRAVIGKKDWKEGQIELKERRTGTVTPPPMSRAA